MDIIDRNITPHNIHEKIQLLKELVCDLESDMTDQNDLKIQMTNYKSIQVIRQRINNFQDKLDRWKDDKLINL